ncbi:hypothetical protein [Clostridium sp. CF012]|uniref:hypothetical protein n=1 Tax=Clostridium sp. CF012 TaxID=2843319 RepID=UPI001C0C62E3|nr:hypothetical protein [Clostridium sp. CF012]MBU3142002.1 hypothetical protein [Clostridium sp. CF012]
MFIFFSSLGLFGFFMFLVWIIIALITKNKKRIPTIGLVVSAVILVTGISIPIAASASNDNKVNSNNEYKITVAGNSDSYEIENVTENNSMKLPIANSNSGEISNYWISKEKGLEIVTSKVKIEVNLQVLYDSQRDINEKTYYLYTLNTDGYTLEDFAYCVDVNSGELFKCSIDMVLSPIE